MRPILSTLVAGGCTAASLPHEIRLHVAALDRRVGAGFEQRAHNLHLPHTEVMRALASHPSFAKIRDAQGPYNGYTPLMDAVWHGHFDAARVLVKSGANLALQGHDGKSALDLAREFRYERIAALLERAGDSR
jgi:hypothetical protein